MRWPLSSLSPADPSVAGDYFEVQIQYLTPTDLPRHQPEACVDHRAQRGGYSRHDQALDPIRYRGRVSSRNGLELESTKASRPRRFRIRFRRLPSMPLVLSTIAIPMPVLSSSDELTIGFESLSVAQSETACQNLSGTNGFVTNVLPQMQSICFNCHLSGTNATGVRRLPDGEQQQYPALRDDPAAREPHQSFAVRYRPSPSGRGRTSELHRNL